MEKQWVYKIFASHLPITKWLSKAACRKFFGRRKKEPKMEEWSQWSTCCWTENFFMTPKKCHICKIISVLNLLILKSRRRGKRRKEERNSNFSETVSMILGLPFAKTMIPLKNANISQWCMCWEGARENWGWRTDSEHYREHRANEIKISRFFQAPLIPLKLK